MVNTLKLPVGIDSFEKIRRNGFYYIDKTNLIEQTAPADSAVQSRSNAVRSAAMYFFIRSILHKSS